MDEWLLVDLVVLSFVGLVDFLRFLRTGMDDSSRLLFMPDILS